jgi:hypothetical protein
MLKEGSVITIKHYSMTNAFKCIVSDISEIGIEVKLPKECMRTAFLSGDPLVVAYETSGIIGIKGARIIDFNRINELLAFSEDSFDEGVKMRSYSRFPVSLYADYRVIEEYSNKKKFALVKDISEYGLMVYSTENHYKGMKMNIDIYLPRDILSMTAAIVRKVEYGSYYEYGLKIKHEGPYVFNRIKNFVNKSEKELLGKYITE